MIDSLLTESYCHNIYSSTPLRSEAGDSDIVIAPLNISMPTDLRERIFYILIFFKPLIVVIIANASSANTVTAGFRTVFDNIIMTIRPRHMTEE